MTQPIKVVGIIGAGTMGQGISQVCALSGYNVLLFDIDSALAASAKKSIEKNLTRLTEKGKITEEQRQHAFSKISVIERLEDCKAQLVIEAVVEKLEVKKKIFSTLENVVDADAILTTNTSSIPVTQIAASLKSPERFAGLHFFNPAPVMKLVEVIKGVSTDQSTVDTLMQFGDSLSKTCVLAQDSPGFIVNRVARHFYVESLKLAEENVADFKTIDTLLKSTGFKMGPFELMDLIGVDVNFSVTSSMFQAFHNDPKFRPSRIQQQKVDAGHFGKKSGKGFYDYGEKQAEK